MIEELEKQIAWQNINTSEEKNKILFGKAIAIESEKIKLTHDDGKIYEENINCIVVNFKNIKVLIPGKELGIEKDDKKNIRNLIGSEIKFIILESDKLTNTAVASRKKAMERIKNIQQKKYQTGDVVYAKVISVLNKYIIVECLGTDVKLKISDLEYGYVANLNNLYQVGDKIKVKVKEIDIEKSIFRVSHKETKEDPYKNVRKNFTEGGEYLATVTGFSDNRSICIFKTRNRHNGHTSSVARNTAFAW
ncbi:MAG: 30S ribosomal protein S1 [Clostridia bacterium]|nr:30S ribosomal protein S1 [Clostridia bacterium]